jgi:hypothetical protein
MLPPIAIDFETPWGKDFSVVDLGYYKYSRDPRCIPYLIAVCDGSESWAGEPKDFNFESLRGRTLLSMNSAFDEEIALAAKERGLFEIPGLNFTGNAHWHCTANMSAYLWNVRSLKDAARIGLGITVSKEVRDRAKDKTADEMKKEGWWQEMLDYGILDAERCWRLWDKHSHKWPEIERRLSRLTIDQGRYGVQIDIPALEDGIRVLQRVVLNATQNLPWVKRGAKPGSPLGMAEECRNVGIPCRPVKAHEGEEAVDEWIEEYAPRFPFVMALKNLGRGNKMLATLQTIQSRLRDDGTATFSLKYCGTAPTFRWAGEGGWNLQNPNKDPLFIDPNLSFRYDPKELKGLVKLFEQEAQGHAALGTLSNGMTFLDLRGLIIARPGCSIGSVDLSQIEPRTLNTIAGNTDFIRLVATGISPYEAHARTRMGWEGGELKTEDKKKYAYAKERVISLGYGCGHDKFRGRAIANDIDIDEGDERAALGMAVDGLIHERAKVGDDWQYLSAPEAANVLRVEGPIANATQRCIFRVKQTKKGDVLVAIPVEGCNARREVEDFRAKDPLITALWKKCDDDFKNSVGEDFTVTLPNGSVMTYAQVARRPKKKIDEDTGLEYTSYQYTAQMGPKRKGYYGGKLVENICQAIARHVFAEGMLRLEDSGFRPLFSMHDEAVVEMPEVTSDTERKRLAKELERLMSIRPTWFPDCPLGAEAKITNRYCK